MIEQIIDKIETTDWQKVGTYRQSPASCYSERSAKIGESRRLVCASPAYAMHAHQRHVPPKIRVFIDFLIETFAKVRYSE